MNISKRLALAAGTCGLIATTALPVFAATPNSTNSTFQDPRQSLMQALIKRFNLSETDLKQFFQEQEQQRSAQMVTNFTDRLSTAVTQGSLTEAQKTALIAKAKEAQAKHEEARKLSPEECKKMMDAYRTELETWLTQQGIDRAYLRDLLGGPGGPRGGHGMGPREGVNGQAVSGQNNQFGAGANGQMGPGRRGGRGMFGPMNGQMGQSGMNGQGMSGGFFPGFGGNQ